MPGAGKGHETAGREGIPRLAASSRSSQPSLDFVGKMKTFHTSIDIPGTTAMVPPSPLRFAAPAHVISTSFRAHF